ncbi:STAS/SEC14 domain-containing protein [Vibrio sp. JPW-9-11-11]|uniref:STAS/SEC14 domain-containing protein n=1 Tax=Vibrio sp. JPW-9-11-11 TaxID=1416532 RepID=UPI0015946B3C|nr:STAS/SEC14 domain-containing protein [Vibrio sp. JPW-9-11-11]NVD07695.1 STAS/SEC14 domain-containing protein [Vibrio sp. JPW-9-11-11]
MSTERHGITLGIERIGSEPVLVFKARGKLTHEDYEAIVPVLDATIEKVNLKHLKMLVDITEFSGWELRAAWDDFQLGLKIGVTIEKIAIYGDKNWQELAAKIASWFIAGEVKAFGNYDSAVNWLTD